MASGTVDCIITGFRPHYERSPALRLHAMPLLEASTAATPYPFCLPKSVHVHTFLYEKNGFWISAPAGRISAFSTKTYFVSVSEITFGMKLNINNFPFSPRIFHFQGKGMLILEIAGNKWNRLPPRSRFRFYTLHPVIRKEYPPKLPGLGGCWSILLLFWSVPSMGFDNPGAKQCINNNCLFGQFNRFKFTDLFSEISSWKYLVNVPCFACN